MKHCIFKVHVCVRAEQTSVEFCATSVYISVPCRVLVSVVCIVFVTGLRQSELRVVLSYSLSWLNQLGFVRLEWSHFGTLKPLKEIRFTLDSIDQVLGTFLLSSLVYVQCWQCWFLNDTNSTYSFIYQFCNECFFCIRNKTQKSEENNLQPMSCAEVWHIVNFLLPPWSRLR